ncbi:hypothetical protein DF185_06370 [Marinifilum breve]|uniref:Uncharacterized protein n=2 Tax=Marinifilum breve TaxID=2184082 RepID=A0A2V4A0S5_9BACT|nr:hypothetical protein DF185_06370 [Marinifilum breve]
MVACVQRDVNLKAKALSDTIIVGKSVKVRLTLEGIDSDIFKGRDTKSSDGFFGDYHQNHDFRTFVREVPKELGKNVLGPYTIKMMDREFVSNKVIVEVIEQPEESFEIKMPKEGRVGEEITIKLSGSLNGSLTAKLKENEIFKVNARSIRTSVVNGVHNTVWEFSVKLKKKGVFEMNRSTFVNLPDQIKIKPVRFEVK